MSLAVCGMATMASSSLLLTTSESMLRVMDSMGLPSLTLTAFCFAIDFCIALTWIFSKGEKGPRPHDRKHVLGASSSMTLAVGSLLLAVKLGTPIGDISALASINVVMAAFFGRLFLGEKLNRVHFFAASCSVVGALLISRPSFIFGVGPHVSDKPLAWIGYMLAPLSGFFDACVLLFSRKAPQAPYTYTAGLYYIQICAFLVALPLTRLVKPESWDLIVTDSGVAIGWVTLLCAIDLPLMVLYMMAARMCPAAISATVDIGTRMVSGYFVQVLFFGGKLEPLTIAGAVFMLAGVVAMACLRQPELCETPPKQPENTNHEAVQDHEAQTPGRDVTRRTTVAPSCGNQVEIESLASFGSFAASEFVDVMPWRTSGLTGSETLEHNLRFRLSSYFATAQEKHLGAPVSPVARAIGAAVSATAPTAAVA